MQGDKKPVVMTEDIDQSVAKKLHAAQHASGGSDPITPAAIGAVNRAGDTMDGALGFSGGLGNIIATSSGSQIEARNIAGDTTNRRVIAIYNSNYQGSLESAVVLNSVVAGFTTSYPFLHTGNKPSGYYTGNGDATTRRIETGGIGNMIAIWSVEYGTSLIFKKGVINRVDDKIQGLGAVATFGEEGAGVLKLTTSSGFVNASGVTYYYQVV